MVRVLAALALLALLAYGAVNAYPLLSGPKLSVTVVPPTPNTPEGLVTVEGRAAHTETLTLNNGALLIDEEGAFYKELLMPRGGAILSLTAKDKFGRSVTVRKVVFIP